MPSQSPSHMWRIVMLWRKIAFVCLVVMLGVWVAAASSETRAAGGGGGGGGVLPPNARPLGWTLQDMARAVAYFSDSNNDPAYFPDTPFQILYRPTPQDPHQGNTFHVRQGTHLYAKFFYIDDAPPPIGDFPDEQDGAAAADYVF